MYKPFAALLLAASLAACGGGGGSSAQAPDYSAAVSQAIKPIVAALPPAAPAYTGAFVMVEGLAVGFVSGPDDESVAKRIAQAVVDNAANEQPLYKLLLSDAGLHITCKGNATGAKAFNGTPIMFPDSNYVAKLTNAGIVLTKQ